jgi:mono/diheme cytochrome c family protein
MAEAITLSTSGTNDDDLHAIAAYRKSVPGSSSQTPQRVSTDDPAMTAGGAIYRDQCSACHGLDGKGIPFLFPRVADSTMARSDDPGSAIRIILRGARSVGTAREPTASGMPAYGGLLNDEQVAAVLTYVRNAWSSPAPAIAPGAPSQTRACRSAPGLTSSSHAKFFMDRCLQNIGQAANLCLTHAVLAAVSPWNGNNEQVL